MCVLHCVVCTFLSLELNWMVEEANEEQEDCSSFTTKSKEEVVLFLLRFFYS